MLTLPTQNTAFSTITPGLQWAWDSTSLGTLKDCARKYYLSIYLGWQPRDLSVHLAFGIYYHSALEAYDRAKFQGATHHQAMIVAVRVAMKMTWNSELKRPWFSDHKEKNRFTLIRTIVWYLIQFEDDSIQTVRLANGKPAVELSFRFQTDIAAPGGEYFTLCGHLDRVGDFANNQWIVDRKTTYYAIDEDYFKKFSPDNQMSTYDFAGGVVFQLPIKGIIIDAAQIQVTQSRFQRGFVPRTQSQRDEWYEHTRYFLRMAVQYNEWQFWPMNDKACHNYGGCPFRGICGQAPEVRALWLERNFVKRIWDPLQIRGDI